MTFSKAALPPELHRSPAERAWCWSRGTYAEALLVSRHQHPHLTASPVLRTREGAGASTPTAALLQLSGTDSHSLPWSLGLWAEHNQNLFLLHECSFWVWPPLPRTEEAQGEEGSSRLCHICYQAVWGVLPTPRRREGAGEQVNEWEACAWSMTGGASWVTVSRKHPHQPSFSVLFGHWGQTEGASQTSPAFPSGSREAALTQQQGLRKSPLEMCNEDQKTQTFPILPSRVDSLSPTTIQEGI